jgi:hypothetical protein
MLPGAQRRLAALLFACIACVEIVPAAVADTNSAASLRARYAALATQSGASQFQRPLYLDSVESSRALKGDIFALVDYPFASVSSALGSAGNWCDVMILHINTKYCRAATDNARTTLFVSVGKKFDQPLDDAYHVEFIYRAVAAAPDYFAVELTAESGPLATSDYRILLEAAPAEGGKTIVHLTYSYAFGVAGRLGMQAYLATTGRSKVGFTITGKQADGLPEYIGGVRGLVERNTMRYFLAIDAYLGALTAPQPEQFEKRLRAWYNSTELYARQLHEVERAAYMEMKRNEYRRQQAAR